MKLDESFPLREKFTRETGYIEKTFIEYSKQKKKDYYIFLDIIYTLAKRSSRWMKGMNSFAERIGAEIANMVEYKNKRFEERREN